MYRPPIVAGAAD